MIVFFFVACSHASMYLKEILKIHSKFGLECEELELA